MNNSLVQAWVYSICTNLWRVQIIIFRDNRKLTKSLHHRPVRRMLRLWAALRVSQSCMNPRGNNKNAYKINTSQWNKLKETLAKLTRRPMSMFKAARLGKSKHSLATNWRNRLLRSKSMLRRIGTWKSLWSAKTSSLRLLNRNLTNLHHRPTMS